MKLATALAFLMISPTDQTELSAPIRLVDDDLPYAAPTIADVDGDGIRDLVVGVYRDDPYTGARVRFFRNTRTNSEPQYAQPVWLQAGGRDASVDEFCHTGFGPQFCDFNNDGLMDLVSGSRDGQLFAFQGQDGSTLQDAVRIAYTSIDENHSFRYNSRIFLHDWDEDGDLDVLATKRQAIWLMQNEGTSKAPAFAEAALISTPSDDSTSYSSSAVADWDGDGTADLIAGMWDGRVMWYPDALRTADAAVPDSGVLLVGPGAASTVPMDADGNYLRPERPAGHVRICVTDHNHDGRLDLLVGDAWRTVHSSDKSQRPPRLTDAEISQRRDRYARVSMLGRQLKALQTANDEEESPEANQARLAAVDALKSECRSAWLAAHSTESSYRHGSVWLFQREETSDD